MLAERAFYCCLGIWLRIAAECEENLKKRKPAACNGLLRGILTGICVFGVTLSGCSSSNPETADTTGAETITQSSSAEETSKLTVHEKGTCLSRSSDGKFQHKSRDSQDDKTQKIDQHKAAAAILPAHPREFPYISAANGAAGGKHNEAKSASKLFTFHKITLPSEVHIRDIIR